MIVFIIGENNLMKKIMFIIPPYFSFEEYNNSMELNIKKPVFTIPYGVLSMLAFSKKLLTQQVEAEVLDLNIFAYHICSTNQDFITESKKVIQKKD